ncbi:MAG: V-type ATP synthase subunit A [Candidatus Njordarchaeales archaeon]
MTRGKIVRINGPLVIAENVPNAKIGDIVYLGEERLISEIVRIFGNRIACQCYEDTSGLRPGDPVINTGEPLSAELAPGLIGQIFDGLQFSEIKLWDTYGPFMQRGAKIERLDKKKRWEFIPTVKSGEEVSEGDIIGTVQETSAVSHRILVPVGIKKAKIVEIYEGSFTITEPIALIEMTDGTKKELTMLQRWPVRFKRPYKARLPSTEPLITGQRVIDTFFPVAKGGTAAIPGGFGTGKTVTLQQLAKWSDADIIIYIGCGERGNEMADVITHFPEIKDPRTGKRLIERSIFIANVSNLPVYAREASIYLGVTIGEYFRDQGYSVALMADSTSRWAEALRDISGRLEEIPAERGFPAYLAERIAEFYERAGRVITLGRDNRIGALTIMGAVSPPGGDFSEPVTSITLRFVGTLWALDKELAFRRHFPAINWLLSFSKYIDQLSGYWNKIDPDFTRFREEALSLLQEASKIEEIARIVGEKALPESQKLILLIAEIIREGYLIQNAFHPVDTYCPPEKQAKMLRIMMEFYRLAKKLVENNVPVEKIRELPRVVRNLKIMKEEESLEEIEKIEKHVKGALMKLAEEYDISLEE